ncbi:hypothetical protein FOL46_003532 [Perkinsus olseni]|uniref:Bacterial surface antigen (D15) domain-containing protein n=1 Tax=Perkinsus olseni TaxID=32597 RepID=A0A7J6M262_PEROL|nr:hypothetical protein FOL46_003532 [Perkinsus olseni]
MPEEEEPMEAASTEMPPEIHRVQDERTPEVRVHVKGRRRLSEALLEKFIGPLRMCDTYGELHDTLNQTIRDLEELNAFEDIRATVDHMPGSPPGSADVTLEVVEKQRNYEAGVDMNRMGEPGADATMNIPYVFGGLTSVSFRYNKAWPGSQMLNASLNIPKLTGVGITPASEGWELDLEASRDTTDHRGYSSSRGVATGLAAVLTDRATGRHTFTLSSTLRDLLPEIQPSQQDDGEASRKPSASYAVRRMPLRTMKTSVKYAYTRDDFRFDETEEGSSHVIGGSLLHAYADLTPGVLGDVSFLKLAGLSECCGYLWKAHDWTWEAGVSGGLIVHPPAKGNALPPVTPFQDRFFLGGGAVDPISGLRGFRYRSAGPAAPRVGGAPGTDPTYDYTGGDMLLSAHFLASMPITWLNNLRRSSDAEPQNDYGEEVRTIFRYG